MIRAGPVNLLCFGILPIVKSSPTVVGCLVLSPKVRIFGSKLREWKKTYSVLAMVAAFM